MDALGCKQERTVQEQLCTRAPSPQSAYTAQPPLGGICAHTGAHDHPSGGPSSGLASCRRRAGRGGVRWCGEVVGVGKLGCVG
jgi:hypothetical protein